MPVFITNTIDGVAAVEDKTWDDIQVEAAKHRRSKVTVESYSEDAEWSDQQRKWWKGILLPALAKHTGDSVEYWETRLKLAVMPDDFQPVTVVIGGELYKYIPSITTLGMTKMNYMVEESVAHLRDGEDERGKSLYGDEFHWVTLPDKELRK